MAASWLGYLGAASGLVGTAAGAADAILGYKGYRRSSEIKRLDPRLELRKAVNRAEEPLVQLPELMDQAERSMKSILAARGLLNSSVMQTSRSRLEADRPQLSNLKHEVAALKNDTDRAGPDGLERRIVDAHRIQLRIEALESRYRASLEGDERSRDRLQTSRPPRGIGR